jgi:hypothetical protein
MTIHFGAIVVAAVVAFVLGFLFHGPIAGKLWMKLANIHPTGKEKMSDMYGKMFWNFVANLVTAFVMALIFSLVFTSTLMGPATALRGAIVGIWFWIGFLVTATSMDVIWMGRSWKL